MQQQCTDSYICIPTRLHADACDDDAVTAPGAAFGCSRAYGAPELEPCALVGSSYGSGAALLTVEDPAEWLLRETLLRLLDHPAESAAGVM